MQIDTLDQDYKIDFIVLTIINILSGIILGAFVEKISRYVNKKFGSKIAIIFQLTILLLILYVIQFYMSIFFAHQWQTITPGIFFVAIYFSIQTTLFTNLTKEFIE
mgnify:CR=1 FL=1